MLPLTRARPVSCRARGGVTAYRTTPCLRHHLPPLLKHYAHTTASLAYNIARFYTYLLTYTCPRPILLNRQNISVLRVMVFSCAHLFALYRTASAVTLSCLVDNDIIIADSRVAGRIG